MARYFMGDTRLTGLYMGPPRGQPRGERRSSAVSEPCRLRRGEGSIRSQAAGIGDHAEAWARGGKNPEYLYLPASEHQIERTLLRVGVTSPHDVQVRLNWDELPEKAADALDLKHLSGSDLPALNRMCQVLAPLKETDMEKLDAVVLMTETSGAEAVCRLAENLDQFDFVPNVQTPEEYGRHMIQESGYFAYDANLPLLIRLKRKILI